MANLIMTKEDITWRTAPGWRVHATLRKLDKRKWIYALCGVVPHDGWADSTNDDNKPKCKNCLTIIAEMTG